MSKLTRVWNKGRHPAADDAYWHLRAPYGGVTQDFLFTREALAEALVRAQKQPEDVPRNWWRRFLGWLWLGMPLLLVVGCGALPFELKKKSSLETAETLNANQQSTASQTFRGHIAPIPVVKVEGKGNTMSLSLTPMDAQVEAGFAGGTRSKASSTMSMWEEYSRYLPWGISLILAGIGILVVLFALKKLRQSSAAANAAFGTADNFLAGQIDKLRAMATSDPSRAAVWEQQAGAMEKLRGKLGRQAP